MVKRVQLLCLGHILHNVCESWGTTHDANPNLWIKPETRPEDKLEYYSYTLYYMDDILCIHHNPDDE